MRMIGENLITMSAPATRPKSMPFSADLTFRSFARLAVRALRLFLLSVATEVDTLIDPLWRELDRRADAVRVGHAALDLPCLANEAPTELPKDNNDRLLPFSNMAVSQQGGGKKETAENPRSTAA
jgi:hypothetical protein